MNLIAVAQCIRHFDMGEKLLAWWVKRTRDSVAEVMNHINEWQSIFRVTRAAWIQMRTSGLFPEFSLSFTGIQEITAASPFKNYFLRILHLDLGISISALCKILKGLGLHANKLLPRLTNRVPEQIIKHLESEIKIETWHSGTLENSMWKGLENKSRCVEATCTGAHTHAHQTGRAY